MLVHRFSCTGISGERSPKCNVYVGVSECERRDARPIRDETRLEPLVGAHPHGCAGTSQDSASAPTHAARASRMMGIFSSKESLFSVSLKISLNAFNLGIFRPKAGHTRIGGPAHPTGHSCTLVKSEAARLDRRAARRRWERGVDVDRGAERWRPSACAGMTSLAAATSTVWLSSAGLR